MVEKQPEHRLQLIVGAHVRRALRAYCLPQTLEESFVRSLKRIRHLEVTLQTNGRATRARPSRTAQRADDAPLQTSHARAVRSYEPCLAAN